MVLFSLGFLAGTVWVWAKTVNSNQYTVSSQQVINSQSAIKSSKNDNNTTPVTEMPSLSTEQVVQPSSTNTTSSIVEKRDSSALPWNFVIAVPFASQAPEKNWDQPWQDACEEAVLLMLDAYYKNYNLSPLFARDEILKMVVWEEARGWGVSIEMEKIKQIGEEYFHLSTLAPQHLSTTAEKEIKQKLNKNLTEIKIVENPTVDDIKKFIVAGNPVLVVADGKVLPNPNFRNGGPEYHALIIKGYDEENFITNDPGTQFGEGFKYKYDDLMNALHDWNNGDVKNGRKVVMVVE